MHNSSASGKLYQSRRRGGYEAGQVVAPHLQTNAAIWGSTARRTSYSSSPTHPGSHGEPVCGSIFERPLPLIWPVWHATFLLWEAKGRERPGSPRAFQWCPFLTDEEVRHAFQRTDFRPTRTAAFAEALSESLTAKILPRLDRAGEERYVCELQGGSGVGKNTSHTRPSRRQSVHQLWQHIRRPFRHAESHRQFMVNRQMQRRSQSDDIGTG